MGITWTAADASRQIGSPVEALRFLYSAVRCDVARELEVWRRVRLGVG